MDHYITEVKIDGTVVVVVCICGWESSPCPTEVDANAEHNTHKGV